MKRPIDSRSYEIEMDSGAVLRRNHRHLRRAHGVPQTEPVDIETVDPPVIQTETASFQLNPQTQSGNGNSDGPMTTRCGRVVRKPQRYKDFTT